MVAAIRLQQRCEVHSPYSAASLTRCCEARAAVYSVLLQRGAPCSNHVRRDPFEMRGCRVRRLSGFHGDYVASIGAGPAARIRQGHIRVHADNASAVASTEMLDSYPLPEGMVTGHARAVIWPPWRMQLIARRDDPSRRCAHSASGACWCASAHKRDVLFTACAADPGQHADPARMHVQLGPELSSPLQSPPTRSPLYNDELCCMPLPVDTLLEAAYNSGFPACSCSCTDSGERDVDSRYHCCGACVEPVLSTKPCPSCVRAERCERPGQS